MKKNIKLCYIGGGSKMWARVFMKDLALSSFLEGEIALYDIDKDSAIINQKIGAIINQKKEAKSHFDYKVYDNLDDALIGANIVVISILPGTFKEMYSDVHTPEIYGIYQSVGDTVGPGGVLRSMRTVPLYEEFALKIKKNCPSAWVINLTNPMSICVKTLFDIFPNIKAFGCCHEVFHTQDLLCQMANELLNLDINRKDLVCDIVGINHFTWFNKVMYKNINLLDYVDKFFLKHQDGYYEHGNNDDYKTNPFAYANLVKYDLFKKYHVLPCAGDRHLVEFLNHDLYLKNKETIDKFKFSLTSVDYRIKDYFNKVQESKDIINYKINFDLNKSQEEVVDLIEALMGFKEINSNVNYINNGQIEDLPLNTIVETSCIFKKDKVIPIKSSPIKKDVKDLIMVNIENIEMCYKGIKNRDLKLIFNSFLNQPLCKNLKMNEAKDLFIRMVKNTRNYLDAYYDLKSLENL